MRLEPRHFRIGEWEVRPNLCTEVGDTIPYHAHKGGHLTLIRRGRWLLRTGDEAEEVASPALGNDVLREWVYIEAGDTHGFELLELEKGVGALWCLWPEGVK
jgi:hypothetical protein